MLRKIVDFVKKDILDRADDFDSQHAERCHAGS